MNILQMPNWVQEDINQMIEARRIKDERLRKEHGSEWFHRTECGHKEETVGTQPYYPKS